MENWSVSNYFFVSCYYVDVFILFIHIYNIYIIYKYIYNIYIYVRYIYIFCLDDHLPQAFNIMGKDWCNANMMLTSLIFFLVIMQWLGIFTRHSALGRMDWMIHPYTQSTCHMDHSLIIWNSALPSWCTDHGYRKSRSCNWKNLEKNSNFTDTKFYSMPSLSMLISSNYLRIKDFVWTAWLYDGTYLFFHFCLLMVSTSPCNMRVFINCFSWCWLYTEKRCFSLKSALWEAFF